MKDSLSYGAYPGNDFHCRDKCRMDSEEFCERERHYISVVKPMPQEKFLLNLDEHSSHTEPGCHWNCSQTWRCHAVAPFPQHASNAASRCHSFQATEYIASAKATNLRQKPGQRVSTEHIASLVGMAFSRASTLETAMNCFRNTGLWPVDRFAFTDDDLAPSTPSIDLREPTKETNCRRGWTFQLESCTSSRASNPKTPGYS
jgi:hypothetical protein